MGGAILQAYRQSSESKAGEYIDRNARLPRRPPEYTGPALRWIGTGKNRYVLVYGKAVVDLMAGEFIGGSDIMNEMNESGELKTLLEQSGATA